MKNGIVVAVVLFGAACSSSGTGGGTGGTGGAGGAGGAGGGTVADAGPAFLDYAIVRFTASGVLDPTFGDGGIAKVDLDGNTATARDTLWSMGVDSTNRLVLFGASRATGRTDADRVVFRLTANGALDPTFGTNGVATLNIGNLGDNARNGIVQPDGKIVSAGYVGIATGTPPVSTAHVCFQRLDSNGAVDPTFADAGILINNPFPNADGGTSGVAESYGVRQQGTKYVSGGYGHSAPGATGTVNQVAFRYNNDGSLDPTFGTNGVFELDLVGQDDRVRNLLVLPDNRVLLLGSGSATSGQIDALATMLTPNGALDTTFNTMGYKLYSFGRPDEAWFGAAVAPNGMSIAAVGYGAGGGGNDDATLLVLPISGTGPTEFAGTVATSTTANDRFWSVTYDASGRILAAGFVVDNGDSKMVLARFNLDGTRDLSFGTMGLATINVSVGRTDEAARAVVVQSDGKIVIAGVADH